MLPAEVVVVVVVVVPAAGPTPLTTADEVGVGRGPFGPTLALLGPAGLAGGIFDDISILSRPCSGHREHCNSLGGLDSWQLFDAALPRSG